MTSNDNPLPAEIRQNVANLGLFVMNQTLSVMGNPQRERLPSLININRELAGRVCAANGVLIAIASLPSLSAYHEQNPLG